MPDGVRIILALISPHISAFEFPAIIRASVMGIGVRNLARLCIKAAILLACASVLAFCFGAHGFAQGDAITVGRPAKKTPKSQVEEVKEGELAPEDEETPPPAPPADEDDEEGPARPRTPLTPRGSEPGGPKELPPGDGATPPLTAGKEGAEEGTEPGGSERIEPEYPIEKNYLRFKSAESVKYEREAKLLTLTGEVVIEIEDITLSADYVQVDDGAKEIYAKGHVAIWREDDIIFGDELFINYESKYFRVTNPSGNSSGKDINGHLYFEGENLEGTFDRYVLYKARATTCEPYCAIDEYHIKSKKIIVHPRKRIVMEHNYSYIREKKVFYWPLIVIPLQEGDREVRRGPFDQNYGNNPTEGWFAKYAWTYSAKYKQDLPEALKGVAILEVMEKKGVNIGQRQDFYFSKIGVTSIWWEYLFSNQSAVERTTASLNPSFSYTPTNEPYRNIAQTGEVATGKKPQDYRYKLTQDIRLGSVSGQMSMERINRYSLFRQRTNTFSSGISLNRMGRSSSTSLSLNQNWSGTTSSEGVESKTINTSGNFSNIYTISPKLSWNISQNYSAYKQSNGGAADQEGRFSSIFDYRGTKYSSSFEWAEDIDFDDDKYLGDRIKPVNHLQPKVSLNIFKRNWQKRLPYLNDINMFLANTQSGPRNELESLVHFQLRTGISKRTQFGRKVSLTTNMNFEQNIYDDGNALYIYSPNVTYEYNPGRWMSLRLGWQKTQPEGRKSPGVFGGTATSSNNFNGNLMFTNHRDWRTTFTSGFDYKNGRWQPVRMSTNFDPNDNFGMTTEIGWDIETRSFQNARLMTSYYADSGNWNLFTRSDFNLSRGAKLPGDEGQTLKHREAIATLQGYTLGYNRRFTRGWDMQVLTEYSRSSTGYKLIRRLALTKVNCCTTMQFAYDAQRKEYSMQVFINAFPGRSTTLTGRSERGTIGGESMRFFLDTPANQLFNPNTYMGGGYGSLF
jgi:hypothetical protein